MNEGQGCEGEHRHSDLSSTYAQRTFILPGPVVWEVEHTHSPLPPHKGKIAVCHSLSVVLSTWLSQEALNPSLCSQSFLCLESHALIHYPQIKTFLSSEIRHGTKLRVEWTLSSLFPFSVSLYFPLLPFLMIQPKRLSNFWQNDYGLEDYYEDSY